MDLGWDSLYFALRKGSEIMMFQVSGFYCTTESCQQMQGYREDWVQRLQDAGRTAVALHVLHTETGFIQASGGEVSEKVNWPLQI